MKNVKNYWWLHVLGCALFIAQPVIFPTHPPGMDELDFVFTPPAQRDFIANIMMLLFFYGNYYLFIPSFYFEKKYFFYGISIVVCLLIITSLPSAIIGPQHLHPPHPHHGPEPLHHGPPPFNGMAFFSYIHEINHHIFLFIAIFSFSLLLRIRERWFVTLNAKNEAEISYLMSQINPHFLFNALNSIYALTVKEKAVNSSEGVLKLSGMMRYVLTETSKDFVPLEKEIQYTNDYIELQKLRLDKSVKLKYECTGVFENKQIAPLLLIPFIENAFKHGVNPDEDSDVLIKIKGSNEQLELDVINNKVTAKAAVYERIGLGIENTRSRLNLIYPGKHQLLIDETDLKYSIKLIIRF